MVPTGATGVLLGASTLFGVQKFRKRRAAALAIEQERLEMRREKTFRAGIEEAEAHYGAKKKTPAEEAKGVNDAALARTRAAHSATKSWLISIVNGENTETRGAILRKFTSLGVHNQTFLKEEWLSIYTADASYWYPEHKRLSFVSFLDWSEGKDEWEQSGYVGSLRNFVTDSAVGEVLPDKASAWERFAGLVETAEEDAVAMEKVDRFIQLLVSHFLLMLNTPAGVAVPFSSEEFAEAERRQEEIGQIGVELLTQDLEKWVARSKVPRRDPIEAARKRAAQLLVEELEEAKRKEAEKAKQEEETARVKTEAKKSATSGTLVGTPETSVEPLVDSAGTLIEEPAVEAFQEAYSSLTEAEQRAGDRYLERIKESADAVNEASSFSASARERVTALATENRLIAVEKLEGLLAVSGMSREAQLVRSLRVSNKYLLEPDAGV